MHKDSKKIGAKRITASIIGLLVIIFVLNPRWIPFVSDTTKTELQATINTYAGQFQSAMARLIGSSDKLIAVVLVFVSVYIIRTVNALIFSMFKFDDRRKETLKVLSESVISYGTVIAGIIVSLSIMGVNMAALFASVGIASLIVGFSAQQIIYDIIAGVFLIFEGQLSVGDIVTINNFRGTVAKIGIRTTQLLDIGGNIQIINNSDINNVQNLSKKQSVAVCDISMSYNQSIEEAEAVVNNTIPYIIKKYPEIFKSAPVYLGVQNLGSSSVDLRIAANVDEGSLYQAKRLMNREFKMAFDANGIEIPFNQLVVTNLNNENMSENPAVNMGNIMKDTEGFKVNTSRYNGSHISIFDECEDGDDGTSN